MVAGAGEPFNPAALIGNSAKLQGLSVGSRDMFEAMCRAIRARFDTIDYAAEAEQIADYLGAAVLA